MPQNNLPCPFCGYHHEDGASHIEIGGGRVKCFSCGASVYDNTTDNALERWNRRVSWDDKFDA